VFAFGQLEKEIDWSISALLAVDGARGTPSVASQIRNLCSRIALIEALFRQLSADEQKRAAMHKLIRELRVIIKFRNGTLHGPWGSYLAERRAWQKPRTDPIDLEPRCFEVSIGAVEQHIERAAETGKCLTQLVQQVTEEHAACD
jgi:hypothetical protein